VRMPPLVSALSASTRPVTVLMPLALAATASCVQKCDGQQCSSTECQEFECEATTGQCVVSLQQGR